jgi:hypothetical protein
LLDAEGEDRVRLLRDISRSLSGQFDGQGDLPPDRGEAPTGGAPIEVSRAEYARWIASALSTDGVNTTSLEDGSQADLAPGSVRRLISDVSPGITQPQPVPGNWAMRKIRSATRGLSWGLRWLFSYSRVGLSVVLLVLFLQMLLVFGSARMATSYAESALEDPAVARLVFQALDKETPLRNVGKALPLSNDQVDVLRAKLKTVTYGEDKASLETARIFGRRTIAGSLLDFACMPDGWLPANDTVALSLDDPILGLTVFEPVNALPARDATSFRMAAATSRDHGRVAGIMQRDTVAILLQRDGCLKDGRLQAKWTPGSGLTHAAVTIDIVGSFVTAPPVDPATAALIVFDEDHEDIVRNYMEEGRDPFSHATAYFPIDAFVAVRSFLQEEDYWARSDSWAAVQTLEQIQDFAEDTPPWLIFFILLGCAVLVYLVIDNLFQNNKRVLALFVAHGMRFRDILISMTYHIMPAVLISFVLLVLAMSVFSLFSFDALARLTQAEDGVWLMALAKTMAFGAITVQSFIFVAVCVWHHRTRSNLKSFLQD